MTGRIVLAVAPDTGPEVVDAAFTAATERGVPLLAVRIRHDPDLPVGGWLRYDRVTLWDAAQRQARRELDAALDHARAAHPEVDVATVVVDDDLVPFLAALSLRAELLVVGRSRRPGRQASPVDVVLRQAACSVLVIPPDRHSPCTTMARATSMPRQKGRRCAPRT
jgi:nucleotide-binding universal stress UspA family protein